MNNEESEPTPEEVEQYRQHRLQLAETLRGQKLVLTKFISEVHDPEWKHDHCDLCWRRVYDGNYDPDGENESYFSDDGRWICTQCFDEFREELNWKSSKENNT